MNDNIENLSDNHLAMLRNQIDVEFERRKATNLSFMHRFASPTPGTALLIEFPAPSYSELYDLFIKYGVVRYINKNIVVFEDSKDTDAAKKALDGRLAGNYILRISKV